MIPRTRRKSNKDKELRLIDRLLGSDKSIKDLFLHLSSNCFPTHEGLLNFLSNS